MIRESGMSGMVKSFFNHVTIILLMVASNVVAEDRVFYYKWNNGAYTSAESACKASLARLVSLGHDLTFGEVVWDGCPRGDGVHCATCSYIKNNIAENKLIVSSERLKYILSEQYDHSIPNVCVANPIDPASGNKLQHERLIGINALHRIALDLFYNSNRREK